MSRESMLMVLGVLVALSPFIGLPLAILAWLLPVVGVLIVLIGIGLRTVRGLSERGSRNESHESSLS